MVPRSRPNHGTEIAEEKEGRMHTTTAAEPYQRHRPAKVNNVFQRVHCQPAPWARVIGLMVHRVDMLVKQGPKVNPSVSRIQTEKGVHQTMRKPKVNVGPPGSTR